MNSVSRLALTAVFAATVVRGGSLSAQERLTDKVTIQLPDGGRISHRCKIDDYTGQEIRLRWTVNGKTSRYPASQVVAVETLQSAAHVKAQQDFLQNKTETAEAGFGRALTTEPRAWVRRDILAMWLRCALRRGDYSSAGTRFIALVTNDPATRHFKLIPLIWAPQELDANLRNDARVWIASPSEAARLIGASMLLFDTKHGLLAEIEMKRLARSGDRRIQHLAQTQLWRQRLKAPNFGKLDLENWQSRIEDISEDLRGGPYYILGRGRLRLREPVRAAAALLWVPMVYDHDYHLAARACLEAADALAEIRQLNEAVTLYREVARFGETPFAQEAASALKAMTSSNAQPATNSGNRRPTEAPLQDRRKTDSTD